MEPVSKVTRREAGQVERPQALPTGVVDEGERKVLCFLCEIPPEDVRVLTEPYLQNHCKQLPNKAYLTFRAIPVHSFD